MTIQEFKRNIDAIELIAHNYIIPFIADVLKAIVTLICLGIKGIALILNYIYKITGGEAVDAAKEFAKNIRDNSRLQDGIKPVGIHIDDGTKPLMIPANINDALGFKLSNHYSVNKYIQAKLKPELTTNLFYMSSYNAPKNRRCKKHHVCIGNRCVPTEIAALTASI